MILPDSVKVLSNFAFVNCVNLEKINLPEGIEEIGSWALASTGIREVSLPPSLKVLKTQAFSQCEQLTDVTIDCPALSDVFGDDGASAFWRCFSLENLELKSLPNIAQGMFANCTSLKNVKMPEDLQAIKAYAFQHAISLETVEFSKYLVNSYYYDEEAGSVSSMPFYGTSENLTLLHPEDGNMWDDIFGVTGNIVATGPGEEPLTEPASSKTAPRVFEIAQDFLAENPLVVVMTAAAALLIAGVGGYHRYRGYKKDKGL